MRNVRLLEIASEYGSGKRGPSLGIASIRIAAIGKKLNSFSKTPRDRVITTLDDFFKPEEFSKAKRIDSITETFNKSIPLVEKTIKNGEFPFVIDGDHSTAAAIISGIKIAEPEKELGVIWIDAHADIHTPYTSETGNMHGMPLAIALNLKNEHMAVSPPSAKEIEYWEGLCTFGGIAPKIKPENIVYIGVRSTETQEDEIIKSLGIRSIKIDELDSKGTAAVIAETLAHLKHCDHFHVSFDVDSMDEALVPGTGTPVGQGLSSTQAMSLLTAFWQSDKLAAMEFTEVNPLLDRGNETSELAVKMIDEILSLKI